MLAGTQETPTAYTYINTTIRSRTTLFEHITTASVIVLFSVSLLVLLLHVDYIDFKADVYDSQVVFLPDPSLSLRYLTLLYDRHPPHPSRETPFPSLAPSHSGGPSPTRLEAVDAASAAAL
jgi:hypothetical protein